MVTALYDIGLLGIPYNVKVKHEPLAGVIGTFEGEDKAPRLKMTNKKWFMAAEAQDISMKPFFIEI